MKHEKSSFTLCKLCYVKHPPKVQEAYNIDGKQNPKNNWLIDVKITPDFYFRNF